MKATKKVVGELEKCYSLAVLNYQGKDHFLCAAEKQNECYLISLEGEIEDTVWEGPGGVMTMIQMPNPHVTRHIRCAVRALSRTSRATALPARS